MSTAPILRSRPNLFTIPPTAPFLESLGRAILAGDLPELGGEALDPLGLADVTILLPSRRAVRAMREVLLRLNGGNALMLPRLQTIATPELTPGLAPFIRRVLIAQGETGENGLAPSVPALEQLLVLTEFVRKWSSLRRSASLEAAAEVALTPVEPETTPAQAAALAEELIALIESAEREGVTFSNLADLVPEQFSAHWQDTLKLLRIVTEQWPAYLADQKLLSPTERQNILIKAEAARLGAQRVTAPVIAAGEVGGVAAVAELLHAVALSPTGAVVLPGLDLTLDDESWERIGGTRRSGDGEVAEHIASTDHPEHPQYGHKLLLDAMGAKRGDVQTVSGTDPDAHALTRVRLISEIMRPAETTHLWQGFCQGIAPQCLTDACKDVTLITTQSVAEEADVIALIMRRVLETPEQTVALVTPDRALARRVAGQLAKWNLVADDSGGIPLVHTPLGAFLDLIAEAAQSDFPPATLMALLKHPLTRLGLEARATRHAARVMELLAFRQPRLQEGLGALQASLERGWVRIQLGEERHPVMTRISEADRDAAYALQEALTDAFAPLMEIFETREPVPLASLAEAHRRVAENLVAEPKDKQSSAGAEAGSIAQSRALWDDDVGSHFKNFFDHTATQSFHTRLVPRDYAGFYRRLMASETLRSQIPPHPRLFIWGQMEARLLQADVVILGGLNEGTWPRMAEPDAWLSRPMRAAIGLSAPERAVGRAAHGFAQSLGAPRLFLTRSGKVDGVPSVPSRWVLRLQALLAGAGLKDAINANPNEPWLGWVRNRDIAETPVVLPRPEPRPPLAARPRRMSVTRIEDWIANPYAIFARFILGLEALPELGREPDAALRGRIIHEAMHRFSEAHPDGLPNDISAVLVGYAETALRSYDAHPKGYGFLATAFRPVRRMVRYQ